MSAIIGGKPWEGTADFLGLYKGVPAVIDYKTSAYNYPVEKILSNPQMPLYAEMAKQALGFEAQKIVYLVFNKRETSIQVLETELTPELSQRALETAQQVAQDLDNRKVWPRNSASCIMGKHVCPWFQKCYGGESL